MATILIPNCIQVNMKGADEDGNELLSVFDVIGPSPVPTLAQVEAARDAFLHWWSFDFIDLVRHDCFMLNITATSRAELNGAQATVAVNAPGGRAADGDGVSLPSGTTLSIKKTATRAGRSYRGRTYAWPYYSTDLDTLDPNQVSTAFVTLLQTTYDNLFDFISAAGYPLGIASNVLGEINPAAGFVVTDREVDSMRRRLSGRGA